MAHKTERHYNDFGGLDTRTNRLLMDPATCREGSKNWAIDFNDNLCKRFGFQHKAEPVAQEVVDTFEYRYLDIDTGANLSEILQVRNNGKLYRRYDYSTFILTVTAASAAYYYSIVYDEALTLWRITFYNASQVSIGQVTFNDSDPVTSLVSSVNLLAITGVTASFSGTGLVPAYLLDTVVMEEFDKLANDVESNVIWSWQEVPYSGSTVPFPLAQSEYDSATYEGCTWLNLNNVIYITDGGWLMKYDGRSVYRAGVPKTFPMDVGVFVGQAPAPVTPPAANTGRGVGGFQVQDLATPTGATALPTGVYKYIYRYGFKDVNGSEYFGSSYLDGSDTTQYNVTVGASENPYHSIPYLKNGDGFGIFTCRLNGDQDWGTGAGPFTVDVDSGHNIVAGMSLMVPSYRSASPPAAFISSLYDAYFAAKVTAVTATTITVSNGPPGDPGGGIFSVTPDNCVINAYYVPADQEDKLIYNYETAQAGRPYGFFVDVFRTLIGADEPAYYVRSIPMPRVVGEEYGFYDEETDANITQRGEFDPEEGNDLPRAGKYIAEWQEQIVQGGRTPDPSLKDEDYPSWYLVYADAFFLSKYSEAHLCDFGSVFWSDALTPEGFPQDGLHQESITSKFNDEISGMGENKDAFFVFRGKTVGLLTGSPATGEVQREILESNKGAISHKAIQEVGGRLIYMNEDSGFYSVTAGQLPIPIGYKIQDYFKNNPLQTRTDRLLLMRSRSVNFNTDDQYICYVPAGYKEPSETSALPNPSASSLFFVLDFTETDKGTRGAWYVWQDVHANGGIVFDSNSDLLITSVEDSASQLWRQKRTGTRYDCADHTEAVHFVMNSAWLTQNMPVIDKHWLRLWISSIIGSFSLTVKQYANFMDYMTGSIDLSFAALSSSKKAVKQSTKLNQDKLSGISIGFENDTINEDVKINGWEIELSADFDPGEPKQ